MGVRELVRDASKGVRSEKFAPSELSAIEAELEDAFNALQRAKRIITSRKVKKLNQTIDGDVFREKEVQQNDSP